MSTGFFGRKKELSALGAALDDGLAGRARVLLVTGEPGIGKTRLVTEASEVAIERGFEVAWGRCWEAGGAPSFWPWLQVLRTLEHDPSRSALADLVPESRRADAIRLPAQEDETSRFRLFEKLAATLSRRATPLYLALDDLHVADQLSLLFLLFLARSLRTARVVIVGTYRDADARRSPEALRWLVKIARESRTFALERLGRDETAALAQASSGRSLSEATLQRIYRSTGGNPLFADEIARGLRVPGSELSDDTPLPDGVREAIAEHLSPLPGAMLELLTSAGVFGREFSLEALAALVESPPAALRAPLAQALAERILVVLPGEPGRYAFSHVLIRDALYHRLEPGRAATLHARIGDWLKRSRGAHEGELSAEIAHHFLAATELVGADAVVSSATRAAEHALDGLAFEDAAYWYERALAVLGDGAPVEQRADLLIRIGDARMCAAQPVLGRAACKQAFELARAASHSELMARAALSHAADFTYASRQGDAAAMLQETLAVLGQPETALAIKVRARLAAELFPSAEGALAGRLGNRAIESARRLNDPETLLYALDAASPAILPELVPAERADFLREGIALGVRLERKVVVLRARGWLVLTLFAAGRIQEAESELSEFERLAREFKEPRASTWQLTLSAVREAAHGRVDGVAACAGELRELARVTGFASAARVAARTELLLAHARGDLTAFAELARDSTHSFPAPLAMQAWVHAALGKAAEARAELSRCSIEPRPTVSTLTLLAECAITVDDRAAALRVLDALRRHASEFVVWNVAGAFQGAVARRLAGLAIVLERFADAERWFEEAMTLESRAALDLHLGHTEHAFAKALLRRGTAADRRRAAALAAQAEARFVARGSALSIARSDSPVERANPAASKGPAPLRTVTMRREGEYWLLAADGTELRLRDSKGIFYLERLLRQPGHELHVLELAARELAFGEVYPADAEPLLDGAAKAAYRRRIEVLDDTIEEASRFGDSARVARARDELERLSQELARAVGLGGRDRRFGSAVEKARVNVRKRLKNTIDRITRLDAPLGRYLNASLRTGTYCVFSPP